MARTTLVMFPVDAGRSLAAGIRDLLHLKAAFWLYFEEADEWRLVLATPLVESEGPKSLYGRLRRFVEQHPELKQIEVTNVSFLSPDDPIVRPIREALNGVDLGEGRLVRRSVITSESTSVYLEEAYIYFAHMQLRCTLAGTRYVIDWDAIYIERNRQLDLKNPFHTYEKEALRFLRGI